MEEKKNNFTNVLLCLLIVLLLAFGGLFVYNEFFKTNEDNQAVENNTNVDNTKNTSNSLTKFSSSYTLTENDKKEIASIIPKKEGLNSVVVDTESITLNVVYDYVIEVNFKEKTSGDSLFAWIIKKDGNYKCVNGGSGYLSYPDGSTDLTIYSDQLKELFD